MTIMINKLLVIFAFLPIFSCGFINIQNKILSEKYRDINNAGIIRINSLNGNIEISGWSKDYIEINARKVLISGLSNDMKLMKVIFEKKDNEFIIDTKIPARIQGKIDLKIYIPFVVFKLYLINNNGDININNFLGAVELVNNSGNINIDFSGDLLRIDSNNARINLNIKSKLQTDMIVNNEDGNIRIYIHEIGKRSFLDVKSKNGNIQLMISSAISHEITALNKNKNITANYRLSGRRYIEGIFTYLYGRKNGNETKINVSNVNGKINFQQIN